jgi:hypothetical protein
MSPLSTAYSQSPAYPDSAIWQDVDLNSGSYILPIVKGTSSINIAANGNIVLTTAGGTVTMADSTGGVTVSSGGVTVTAGGVTITAGGITVTAGGVAVVSGGITLTGAQIIANTSGNLTVQGINAAVFMAGAGGGNNDITLSTTGVTVGRASTAIGFLGTTPVLKQTGPTVNITNSVTAGGVDGTIANFTDLTVYANDAAAIRNDIYQLARAVKFCSDALRAYGLLT